MGSPLADAWVRDFTDEAAELLQALLRVDTSNPPGGETAAALVLQDYLESNGVSCELVARDPARANLVARLEGSGSGPSLALVGHLDVVPTVAADWARPPFSGHVDADGFMWGRGAADMKNEVATRAVVLATLAREGFVPSGDLTLVATADEEDGTNDVGAGWLLRERPDLRTDYVLNEGAAERLVLADGRVAVTVNIGEKAAANVRITTSGATGASTLPTPGEGAVGRLAKLIERLDTFRPRSRRLPETDALLDALLGPDHGDTSLAARLEQVVALHPAFADLVVPLFTTTIAPTRLHGSDALNVVPPRASVDCDVRLLPRTTEDELRAELVEALGRGAPYEIEMLTPVTGGTISPVDTSFVDTVASILGEVDPAAVLVPTILNGFTDSHYYREYFGSHAYGFWPVLHTPYDVVAGGVHGNDERIHVDDLGYATGFQLKLCRDLLKSSRPSP